MRTIGLERSAAREATRIANDVAAKLNRKPHAAANEDALGPGSWRASATKE